MKMALRMTTKTGITVGVFNQGNGDYIAVVDEEGFHHAPSQYAVLPQWSEKEARKRLAAYVREMDSDD